MKIPTCNATLDLWTSGFVNRWHTFPDRRLRGSGDTVGSHAWRVAVLTFRLLDNTTDPLGALEAIIHAVFHDSGEGATADLPGPFKANNPDLANRTEGLAAGWLMTRAVPPGNPLAKGTEVVNLADSLDHYLFITHEAPDLRTRGDIAESRRRIEAKAKVLGLESEVWAILNAAEDLWDYRLGGT